MLPLTWFSCYLKSEISICTLVHALLSIYRLIAISGLKAMMCYGLQYQKFRPAVKALCAPSSLSSYSSRTVHAILSIPRACASAKRGIFVMAMPSSSVNEASQFSRHNVRLFRHGNVLRVAVGKGLKAWYGVEKCRFRYLGSRENSSRRCSRLLICVASRSSETKSGSACGASQCSTSDRM
jgi:hypothetical protein